MAQQVHYTLVDDIDGSTAEESVSFGLDGRDYKIDLSSDNAAKLRDALALYVAHAESASRGGRRPAARAGRSRSRSDAGAVREWARANNLEVSERGRIPADIQQAYDAAH